MSGPSAPAFGGVGLEQYAGITAAVAEGIALDAVLAQEGIEPSAWPAAERAWREALVPSLDLQLRYLELRRQAEDCLARRIEPLDADAEAWTALLSEVAMQGGAVLGRLGLRPTDLARLGRAWGEKAAADPAVHKRLSELAGKGRMPARVRAEASRLKPFPWTHQANADGAGGGGPARQTSRPTATRLREPHDGRLPIEEDIELWAALVAISETYPALATCALELCGVAAAERAALERAWRERLRGDAALRAHFVVHLSDHRTTLAHWVGEP